jgi:hypothetical protein
MKVYILITEHFDDSFDTPVVTIQEITERPNQSFTAEQLETMPEQFRCYSCLETFPRESLGGLELEQTLCRYCYPCFDRRSVYGLIKFDIRHGSPVTDFGQTKTVIRKQSGKMSPELQKMMEPIFEWAAEREQWWKEHGFGPEIYGPPWIQTRQQD